MSHPGPPVPPEPGPAAPPPQPEGPPPADGFPPGPAFPSGPAFPPGPAFPSGPALPPGSGGLTAPGFPPLPAKPPLGGSAAYPPPQGLGSGGTPYVTPQPPSRLRKWGGLAGGLVVAGVIGASWLGVGAGDPEVGDCVAATGESTWKKVDCGDAAAEARVVGIEEERQTEEEFMADADTCTRFPTAEMFLWSGSIGQAGSVLCAEPLTSGSRR